MGFAALAEPVWPLLCCDQYPRLTSLSDLRSVPMVAVTSISHSTYVPVTLQIPPNSYFVFLSFARLEMAEKNLQNNAF